MGSGGDTAHRAHHLRPLYISPDPLASHSVHQRQPRRPRQSHQSQNGNFRLNLLGPLVPDPIEPQFMPDCQSTPASSSRTSRRHSHAAGSVCFSVCSRLIARSRLTGTRRDRVHIITCQRCSHSFTRCLDYLPMPPRLYPQSAPPFPQTSREPTPRGGARPPLLYYLRQPRMLPNYLPSIQASSQDSLDGLISLIATAFGGVKIAVGRA